MVARCNKQNENIMNDDVDGEDANGKKTQDRNGNMILIKNQGSYTYFYE